MSDKTTTGTLFINGGMQTTIRALRQIGFNLPIRYGGDNGIVSFGPTLLNTASTIKAQGFPGVVRIDISANAPLGT